MRIHRRLATAVLMTAALGAPGLSARQPPARPPVDAREQAALADFARRTQEYVELHRRVACTVPELRPAASAAEIRPAVDALAVAITAARPNACAGDIFTPEIVAVFRRLVHKGCQGRYYELMATVTEEFEAPLPPVRVHGRWPAGTPLPFMPLDLLAALPPLPTELEYRFMYRDLILRDVDANLIVDFVPNAVPLDLTRP
jgi:hypothetical protein